ncbi:hypothetical protein RK21_01427 [Pseudomonas plecoglossicida]|nr:hypothetical protein RK21_01427 [Pseudomonas plecoglossicida]
MAGVEVLPVPALSRVNPLLQGGCTGFQVGAVPVGAGLPAKRPVQD